MVALPFDTGYASGLVAKNAYLVAEIGVRKVLPSSGTTIRWRRCRKIRRRSASTTSGISSMVGVGNRAKVRLGFAAVLAVPIAVVDAERETNWTLNGLS